MEGPYLVCTLRKNKTTRNGRDSGERGQCLSALARVHGNEQNRWAHSGGRRAATWRPGVRRGTEGTGWGNRGVVGPRGRDMVLGPVEGVTLVTSSVRRRRRRRQLRGPFLTTGGGGGVMREQMDTSGAPRGGAGNPCPLGKHVYIFSNPTWGIEKIGRSWGGGMSRGKPKAT